MSEQLDFVLSFMRGLQETMVRELFRFDGTLSAKEDRWERPDGGGGRSRAFQNGQHLEKAGINFSHVHGEQLPPSATARRPEIANRPFDATGVSVVFHPMNPYIPAAHMNVRYFEVGGDDPDADRHFWFGGGFDLTPCYAELGDAVSWHRAAKAACDPWGDPLYAQFKAECDRYFYLPHRRECRGVGGLFFDDFAEGGFGPAFGMTRSIGEAFWPAWKAIAHRHLSRNFNQHEKRFQQIRRGRYAEFNLLYDRGTLFGLQSGGRTESILMSMPPSVAWEYAPEYPPDSREARLAKDFLQPREWLQPGCPHLTTEFQ